MEGDEWILVADTHRVLGQEFERFSATNLDG